MKLPRLILCLALVLSPWRSWSDPQLYRLVRGSTLSVIATNTAVNPPVATTNTYPIEGTFFLTAVAGPLDWNYYQISDLRLDALNGALPGWELSGSGTYRQSVLRLPPEEQMTLATWSQAWGAVAFSSPAQAITGAWPALDVTLTADLTTPTPEQAQLHLVAVPELQRWHYRLLDGSTLLDECPICDHLSRPVPLRGDFDLVLVGTDPLNSHYHLFNVLFLVENYDAVTYMVGGEGDYTVGGEVAVRQTLTLDVDVLGQSAQKKTTGFTNVVGPPGRLWPMLAVDVDETQGTATQFYHLQLRAAPLTELWFTTTQGFTPSSQWTGITNPITGGDVISDLGRVVKWRADLLGQLGLGTNVVKSGVDAFDLAPGGTGLVSLTGDATSAILGALQEGDLLSESGTIVKRNQDLTAKFGLMPIVPDAGLDAVQVLDSGEILFSIRQDQFAEAQGVNLGHGDILSDQGAIRRSNASLLAHFQPAQPGHDYGLDALYVWPSGEVWFSTEEGFTDQVLGAITDGDLLSDQGYVVFPNLELVGQFLPQDNLTNYGLRSLFVVTDARPALPAPTLAAQLDGAGGLRLNWTAKGRCFQVDKAPGVSGPFQAASPILTANHWTDSLGARPQNPVFYRLRQW